MNKSLKINQQGLAHLGLLLVVTLVVGAVGFTGYRIVKNSNNQSNSRTANSSGANGSSAIKGGGTTVDELGEKELENNKIIEDAIRSGIGPDSYNEDGDPGVEFVNFVKGGASLVNNESVNVTFVADRILKDGECKFLFYLGNSSVDSVIRPVDTDQCHTKVPISKFPKSGIWYVTVAYDSDDRKITGVGGGIPVEVMPTITQVNFTKGGSGISNGTLSVSATMDKTVTGTCTYTFSLNGSVRVEKSSNQKGDNFCKVNIPVSAFPKSATYNMVISFVSNDGFTQGSTSWDVTIE